MIKRISMSLFILCYGCGPKLAPELAAPDTNIHPSCPHDTHMWSVGMADGPEAAIRLAKENISSAIQSDLQVTISSVMRDFERLVIRDGATTQLVESEELAESIYSSQTEFSHAELMEVIISPTPYNNQYYTLVCLNRKNAVDVLMDDVQPNIARFTKYAELADKAYQEKRIKDFADNFSRATEMRERLIGELGQVRTLMGRKSNTEREIAQLWMQIQEQSIELIESIEVGVTFVKSKQHTLDIGDQSILEENVRIWLTEFGLQVNSATVCQNGLADYIMEVTYVSNCGWQPISNMLLCKPELSIAARDCVTQKPHNMKVLVDGWVGSSFDRNESKALHNAFLEMKKDKHAEAFRDELYKSLRRVFPLQK